MNKTLIVGSVVLGVLCVMIAFVYWTTPATLLPSFFPGHEAGSITVHVKHGIAAFAVGLALFVFAWFKSGKKKPSVEDHDA